MPPEYCKFGPKPRYQQCLPWLAINRPELVPAGTKIPQPNQQGKNGAKQPKKKAPPPSKNFLRWPEIESFSHLKVVLSKDDSLPKKLNYRYKIKLHGTNAAVGANGRGEVWAQRRNGTIVLGADPSSKDASSSSDAPDDDNTEEKSNGNFEFDVFASRHQAYFKHLQTLVDFDTVAVFGEWCGRGIMNGAAICTIPTRHFAVFSIVFDTKYVLMDPVQISNLLGIGKTELGPVTVPPELLVVPWGDQVFDLDYAFSNLSNMDASKAEKRAALQKEADRINQLVASIDASDPFVLERFGIDGIGEGIVCYPTVEAQSLNGFDGLETFDKFSKLIFKAKGRSHRVMASKHAATIDTEVAATINEFVDMFVTTQRCEQGFVENCLHLRSLPMGSEFALADRLNFVEWMRADVFKEGKEEMGNLKPKAVTEAVKARSLLWFDAQANLLGISLERS